MLSNDVLRHLQKTLLKVVLLSQGLTGGNQIIKFPDLSFIQRQSTVILIDENLAHPFSIEELPTPIRILSREVILQEARKQGDIVYLRFQPTEREGNAVRLTLEAKIAFRDPDQRPLGLSGIQVKFHEFAGQWEITEEPIFFAT